MSIIDIHSKLAQAQQDIETNGADAIVIMVYRSGRPSLALMAADDVLAIGMCETTASLLKARLLKNSTSDAPSESQTIVVGPKH